MNARQAQETMDGMQVMIADQENTIMTLRAQLREADAQAGKYVDDYNQIKAKLETRIHSLKLDLHNSMANACKLAGKAAQ